MNKPASSQNHQPPGFHSREGRNDSLNRREFLAGLAALAAAGKAAQANAVSDPPTTPWRNEAGLPLRTLGRTKEKVTLLGLGSAPVGHSMPGADKGVPVYRAALEAGINYVDTARGYDDAEDYLGELVPRYRDGIFLATKALPNGDNPKEASRQMRLQFESSLRRLKTDHVDLLHIHNVGGKAPELILGPGGPLEFVRQMKQEGKTRFVGLTGHTRVGRFAEVIETGEIDVIMVVLNFVDYHTYRFEADVLPVARKHNCGIVAMKVFGGHRRGFAGYRQPGPSKMTGEWLERALRYSLSIPGLASAVIGVYSAAEMNQNIAWAKANAPLSPQEMDSLRQEGKQLAALWSTRFGPA